MPTALLRYSDSQRYCKVYGLNHVTRSPPVVHFLCQVVSASLLTANESVVKIVEYVEVCLSSGTENTNPTATPLA